jgi:Zn-dependent protease
MATRFSFQSGLMEVGQYHTAPIYLYPGFFVTAFILAWPFWRMVSLHGLALGALFMAVMFASILAHELAHAAVARRYQLPVQRIDIHMLGGLVQYWHLPHTPRQDFAITLAGPVSNLAIGLVALIFLATMPHAADMLLIGNQSVPGPPTDAFLEQLLRATLYLNLGLCAVNLIPAFPLDGGKLAHLLIEKRWGSRPATLVVGGLGLVFACLSTLVLISTTLAGFPIWAPPSFDINWRAFQAAWRGLGGWDRFAFQ